MSRVKRYQIPEVYEALAAEYVLGTLTGKARLRFERLLHERPYIRHAVDIWERRFGDLGQSTPEVAPPKRVWQKIKEQIVETESISVRARRFWQSIGFWQSASAAMAIALTITLLPLQPQKMAMPSYVAVLESAANQPMLVTMGDAKKQMVAVRLVKKPQLDEGKALELWAIPKGGGDPVSVGMIKTDSMESELKLSKSHWKRIMGAEMFAVTFEDASKPQSGKPTGPIMYKGQCVDFI
ncbi:MAG: anti-sigma factor [bacterium]